MAGDAGATTIGILGLQGACRPHARVLQRLGVAVARVVFPEDLTALAGLILPGGESTTMLKMATPGLWPAIQAFAERRPVWGVCAGCILMGTKVENPPQAALGLVEMTVRRNGYGAQNESFIAELELALDPPAAIEGIFIRAPIIAAVGPRVEVLAEHRGHPVLLASGRHLLSTFHPELQDNDCVHRFFLDRVKQAESTCQQSTLHLL